MSKLKDVRPHDDGTAQMVPDSPVTAQKPLLVHPEITCPHFGDQTPLPKGTKCRHCRELRFIRLAIKRVPKTIKCIRAIANLSNRNIYEYTQEQTNRIISVLALEFERLSDAFDHRITSETTFTF